MDKEETQETGTPSTEDVQPQEEDVRLEEKLINSVLESIFGQ